MKKTISLIIVLICLLTLNSCSFDESVFHLSGGELLDEEKMSEIKNEILQSMDMEEISNETEFDDTDMNASENETDDEKEGFEVVYWTESGKVWHLSSECYHLKKSSEVNSGTVEEAKDTGKEKPCSSCNK